TNNVTVAKTIPVAEAGLAKAGVAEARVAGARVAEARVAEARVAETMAIAKTTLDVASDGAAGQGQNQTSTE
ncbi:unnamed protein product, partial [Ixodes persulcatus]